MRKLVINLFLIVSFVAFAAVITLFFMAELQLAKAKEFQANYLWKKAGEKYQAAVHLNPLNAEYFAESGNFMAQQANYHTDKLSWLKRAEKLYQRACEINPEYAEYRYLLGKARLELGDADIAINDFKMAIEKDPYNFSNNYLIGYISLKIWAELNEDERQSVQDRLKYVLDLKPWYSNVVYGAIMHFVGDFRLAQLATPGKLAAHQQLYSFIVENNIWQYRKAQKNMVDFYKQKEKFEEFSNERRETRRLFQWLQFQKSLGEEIGWVGSPENGKDVYQEGQMYWSGTMHKAIEMPQGRSIIKIRAKADQADNIWPYMIVQLDGQDIGEAFVDNHDWREYHFKVKTDGGIKVLSVTFSNDGAGQQKNEDRNLYIGEATVTERVGMLE